MSDVLLSLMAGGFALGGVVVGQFASTVGESRQWRREWIATRITTLQGFYVEVVDALNAQHVVIGQHIMRVKGLRPDEVPIERTRQADQAWRLVLSRSVLTATKGVQLAMGEFDTAREQAVAAVNNAPTWLNCDEKMADLEAARAAVLGHMNEDVASMNLALAAYLIPAPQRLWSRLRGKSPVPEL